MFAFLIHPNTKTSILDIVGLQLEKNDKDNYDVIDLTFMGAGEKKGIKFYDEVTHIEISSLDRPAKEFIYILGLLLLLLTILSQKRKLTKNI